MLFTHHLSAVSIVMQQLSLSLFRETGAYIDRGVAVLLLWRRNTPLWILAAFQIAEDTAAAEDEAVVAAVVAQ